MYSVLMKCIEGGLVSYSTRGSISERMRALRVDNGGPIRKQAPMAGSPQPSPAQQMPPDPAMASMQQQMPMNTPGPNGMPGAGMAPLQAIAGEIEGIMDASIMTMASAEELLSVSRDADADDLAMASQALHSLEGTLKQIKHTELGIVAELFRKVQAGIEKNQADGQLSTLMNGGM